MNENEQMAKVIEIAKTGKIVKIKGIGNSMRPFLHGGRDSILLKSITSDQELKKGDVVLYFSNNKYILHRIYRISGNSVLIVGDGNQYLEGPFDKSQLILKAVGFQRKGKLVSVDSFHYKLYSSVWLFVYPIRPAIRRIKKCINDILKACGLYRGDR